MSKERAAIETAPYFFPRVFLILRCNTAAKSVVDLQPKATACG
jgi:hypothetical protein